MNPAGNRPIGRRAQRPTGEARGHAFEEVQPGAPNETLGIDDLKLVKLRITADLGQCTMLVRDVLELHKGSVIPLDKLAGEMTDVYINDLPLAKGEVVVIGDALHVRLGEVLGSGGRPEDEEADFYDDEAERNL